LAGPGFNGKSGSLTLLLVSLVLAALASFIAVAYSSLRPDTMAAAEYKGGARQDTPASTACVRGLSAAGASLLPTGRGLL